MKVSLIKQKGIKLSQTTALRGLVECWLSGAMELARKKRSEGKLSLCYDSEIVLPNSLL